MTKKWRIFETFLLSIFFTLMILGLSDHIAEASSTTLPNYYFQIGTTKIEGNNPNSLYNYGSKNDLQVYIMADGWPAPTDVVWTSTQEGVVTVTGSTSVPSLGIISRKGPGKSIIYARFTQGGIPFMISFTIQVGLDVDKTKSDMVPSDMNGGYALVLNNINDKKTLFIKYIEYDSQGNPTGNGDQILSGLTFDSDNKGVATVDSKGVVTAVGSGSANITITNSTTTEDTISKTVKVVVGPHFYFTYSYLNSSGDTVNVKDSSVTDNQDSTGFYYGVPPSFNLVTDAKAGANLTWVVYNVVNGKPNKVSAGTSDLMTYTVNDSGSVTFTGIKSGTYEIYAYTDPKFDMKSNNIPYAYMKISVPVALTRNLAVMNVGDTYNLMDNSNIPSADYYNTPTGYDSTIVSFDHSNYVITAKKQGTTTINLVYNKDQHLFATDDVSGSAITIRVIDGLTLNISKATLNTSGQLQLVATATDPSAEITWSTSDAKIATVTDGLVTAAAKVSGGGQTVIITAKQTINGVVKKATCEILVQQSVSAVTITSTKHTIAIGESIILTAAITPKELSGVTLTWQSSDATVVSVGNTTPLSATVTGLAGGHAVIAAINKDNAVVGYYDITVQQPVTGITLSSNTMTVDVTTPPVQLQAVISPDNAVNKKINWESSNTGFATVDANGTVTFKKAGSVTIYATSEDNPKVRAFCNITIQVKAASLSLDEATKTMYVGESARLTYDLLPANASNNALTWISTNTQAVTVDKAGKVTAKGVGTSVVMAKTVDGGLSAYCTITVKLIATSVAFDVSKLSLKTSEYYVLKTILLPKGSTDNDLTWESSDTKIATVDTEGKIVGKSAGICIISAKTIAGGVAYCTVTVTQAVTGLVLNFSDKTIAKGEKFTLEASITPTNASKPDVTWKSSNTSIATIDSKGNVTGVAGGVTIITCITADGGYAATCVLTVKEVVTSLTINYESYNLGIDKVVKLVATVTNPTASNQKVIWKSSNSKVATVSSTGKVRGIKAGYATITATSTDESESEVSCDLRVVTLASRVELNKTQLSMFVGESKKLKASVAPSKATLKGANWSSADSSIAIVDEDGNVIGLKAGNVIITATAQDSSGKKDICYVSVNERLASTGVTLSDKKITMVPGENKIVEMVLIPTASTDSATWSSDNAAVASVNKTSGKITAKSTGTAYITVMTDSGKTATVEVTVIGLNYTQIVTEQYTKLSKYLNVEGSSGTVVYQSGNPLIASVSSDGTVTAYGAGTTTITATVNGRRLTCKVKVNKLSS